VIVPLCLSRRTTLFARLVDELKINPVFASVVLCQRLKAFRREGLKPSQLSDDEIYAVFKAYAEGKLAREGVVAVLEHMLRHGPRPDGDGANVTRALAELDIKVLSDEQLHERISEVLRRADDSRFKTLGKKYRFVMGELMRPLVGCVEGRRLARLLGDRLGVDREQPVEEGAQP
jgi:Glu-tRNA(Gln) amidotransferase subunit E-like FAD-binding protein